MPELVSTLFSDAVSLADRVDRLIGELSGLYERAGGAFVGVRREAHLLEPLREWLEDRDRAQDALVREALSPANPEERTIQGVRALTGFAFWEALLDAGVPRAAAPGIIRGLVLGLIPQDAW